MVHPMRRPIDPRSLNQLLRRPAAMNRFLATGDIPSVAKPASPLITLLESLTPRERSRIVGLQVDPALGYSGSRQFHNASQALNWLNPVNTSSVPPSQSWQDRRFQKCLTIEDIQAHARVPEEIVRTWWQRHPHLRQHGQAAPSAVMPPHPAPEPR